MKLYKIRNKTTGLFSTGGCPPSWTKEGKTWTNIKNVKLHLKMFEHSGNKRFFNEMEVIEYDCAENKIESPVDFLKN